MAIYDPINYVISLDDLVPVDGLVNLDVRSDLYSDAKRQWLNNDYLNQFTFPWSAIGGQDLPGGAVAPQIYFLKEPWTIKPFEGTHKLDVQKNLFRDDGEPVFTSPTGLYTVEIDLLNEFTSGDPRVDTALAKLMQLCAILKGDLDILQAVVDGTTGYHRVIDRITGDVLIDKDVTKTGNLYEFRDPT